MTAAEGPASFGARTAYAAAAACVADLVDHIAASQWAGPGLGAWDLRALVGHTSRALVTVVTYLQRPAASEQIRTPAEYYARAATIPAADAAQVTERARQAGLALGPQPAVAWRDLVEEATRRLAAARDEDLIETIGGGMRVDAYLPTRTFELVVHGYDIAAAARRPVHFPLPVVEEMAALAARTAVHRGHGPLLLKALTGRAGLPDGFGAI